MTNSMAKKRTRGLTAKTGSKKAERGAVQVTLRNRDEDPDDATARMLTRPEVQAAALIQKLEGDNHCA